MDQRRFDDIAGALSRMTDRRRVAALIGALLGGEIFPASGRAAAAPRLTCRRMRASCTRGSQCCSGYCATGRSVPRSLRNRCACPPDLACGAVCCAPGEVCLGGSCIMVCEVESPATFCVVTPAGEVVQTCGGESEGYPCNSDADCVAMVPWCTDPGFDCVCAMYQANEMGDVITFAEGSFAGICAVEQLPHQSLGCEWGKCSRKGGPCEIPPDCCSYLFAPNDTACNNGQCAMVA